MINVSKYLSNLRFLDGIFILCSVVLFCFGLAAIYSVNLSDTSLEFLAFKKQIFLFGIGMVFFLICCVADERTLKQYSFVGFALSVILLLAVLFFGRTIRGTTGWFVIGAFQIQPVEFTKIALILVLALFFSNRSRAMDKFSNVLLSAIFPGILAALTLLQPDLGSATVLVFIWFGMLISSGVKKRYIFLLILSFIVTAVMSWFFVLAPFQKARLVTFMNPAEDPLGSGYNVIQSMIAVGSGQMLGQGLGAGTQSQLKFLPEAQTDFLFAVLAEELGFVGISLIFIVWLVLFYRLIVLTKSLKQDFDVFIVLGTIYWLLFQIMQNIGMNMGLMPVSGLTLPLMSAGGSSLLAIMIMFGILGSIMIRHKMNERLQ